MIGTQVEVEYEENINGVVKYLRWIKGTIMDYDKENGYPFPDDVDWIKTLNSEDVRIIKYTFMPNKIQLKAINQLYKLSQL